FTKIVGPAHRLARLRLIGPRADPSGFLNPQASSAKVAAAAGSEIDSACRPQTE
ncbi:MAG: hypothetical protein QOC70_2660, partial [Verrucomicrobiota bacterium]